jgi:hypothetical protein
LTGMATPPIEQTENPKTTLPIKFEARQLYRSKKDLKTTMPLAYHELRGSSTQNTNE